MTGGLAVHFGNRIGSEGGIASVLDVLSTADVPGWTLSFVPTYDRGTSRHGGRLLGPAAARALLGRADVVHVHLSERGSFLREGMLVGLAAARHRPVVVTLHGAELADFARDRPSLVRTVLRRADVVLALSEATAAVARDLLPDRTVQVLPNPVVVPERPPSLADEPQVLFAGEQGRRKGFDVLLAAWPQIRAAVPAARLVVAGIRADVPVPPLAGLDDLGLRSRAEVRDLILKSRVCVLPSRYEVLPMFLLEAMSLGRPVVVTAVGGVAELVADAGSIVPVGDADALAEAVVELLRNTPLAERLAAAGHDRVRDNSVQNVATRLGRVYDSVSAPSGKGGETP